MAMLAPANAKGHIWLMALKLMTAAVAARLWKDAHARIAAHGKR
jgi:hypothetical protein